MKLIKNNIGILLCILFVAVFDVISNMLYPHFDGAYWYSISSIQRFLFFVIELYIFIKIFKRNVKDILNFKNFKYGLISGVAMFAFVIFNIITYNFIGAKSWVNTTIPILVSCLLFQQLTTGLWEEITFRLFICEGYYLGKNKTFRRRLIYAIISFIIFGLCHSIECSDLSLAIYRFITTGIWGFAFASIYLYTNNIVAAMFMHFFTDIFLNMNSFVKAWSDASLFIILDNYVQFVFLAFILIVAIYYLKKEPLSKENIR